MGAAAVKTAEPVAAGDVAAGDILKSVGLDGVWRGRECEESVGGATGRRGDGSATTAVG